MKVTKSTVQKWRSLKKQISELQKQFYRYDKRLKALEPGKYFGIEVIEQVYLTLDAKEMSRREPSLSTYKTVKRRKVKG